MFAQLGEIKFELITYFNGFNETKSYNYASHERINNTPLLQFLGKNLKEEVIKLNFHSNFCNPEEEIKKISDVADKALPLKFIKGNGEYIGVFVIEEISQVIEQSNSDGDLISIQLELKLKEFTGKLPENNEEDKGFKQRQKNLNR